MGASKTFLPSDDPLPVVAVVVLGGLLGEDWLTRNAYGRSDPVAPAVVTFEVDMRGFEPAPTK